MQANIREFAPVHIACIRHIGPMGAAVDQFWHHTMLPWLQENGLENAPCYGIGHDDPGLTPPDRCRYDACVEVAPDFLVATNIHLTTLPGGWYAVTGFRGTAENIIAAWSAFFEQWLPGSGFSVDATRPCFEYYAPGRHADPGTGELTCDLCMPVLPK